MYTKYDKLSFPTLKLTIYKNMIVILVDETKHYTILMTIFPSIVKY